MKNRSLGLLFLAFGGTALAGWALFSPLVTVPVVGSIRFSESHLGGPVIACSILALMALGSAAPFASESLRRFGHLLAGAALGLVLGSLIAIYKSTLDQLQQLADAGGQSAADVARLLAGLEYRPAMFVLAAGFGLWLVALLVAPRQPT